MLRPHESIYGLQASILKTIASPRRLEMIHFLGEAGPMEVRALAAHFGMSQPAVSQHLAALRDAGMVEAVRSGREVRYRLSDPEIVQACEMMRQVLVRRLSQLGNLAAEYGEPQPEPVEVAAGR